MLKQAKQNGHRLVLCLHEQGPRIVGFDSLPIELTASGDDEGSELEPYKYYFGKAEENINNATKTLTVQLGACLGSFGDPDVELKVLEFANQRVYQDHLLREEIDEILEDANANLHKGQFKVFQDGRAQIRTEKMRVPVPTFKDARRWRPEHTNRARADCEVFFQLIKLKG